MSINNMIATLEEKRTEMFTAIENDNCLSSGEPLKVSQELDEIIVLFMRKQLTST